MRNESLLRKSLRNHVMSRKKARLKFERIQRMQMKDQLLEREKELFLKMLFNRETTFF